MDDTELLRYSRQILLPQVEIAGQMRLRDAKALIIGMGGLGSPVAMYLAAAGVGQLRICDYDTVDLSNLQRQIIHNTDDIGTLKVDSAKVTLQALNPLVEVITFSQALAPADLLTQVSEVDVVVDCSDNLSTRLDVNQACVTTQTPLVSGAAIRFEGQIAVFNNQQPDSPCYRCLYESTDSPTETCSQTGVFAPLVGIIGSMQALETLKVLMAVGTPLYSQLLLLDALHMEWCNVKLRKKNNCPVCGNVT